MKICPNCNKEFSDNIKFCTHCGCELNEEIHDTYKGEEKKPFKWSWVLIIGICVFLVVAVFCYFSRTRSSENTEPETPEVIEEEHDVTEDFTSEPEIDYEQIKREIKYYLDKYVLSDGEYYYIFEENGKGRILSTAFPGKERIKPFYNSGMEISFDYKIVDSQVQIITNQKVQMILNYEDKGTFLSEEGIAAYSYLNGKEFYSEWANAAHRFEVNADEEETYQYWDMLLNDVYGYLQKHLSTSEFKALKEEEITWIRKKEAAMKDAETSSLKYETGAIWTEKRVNQLIEMIPF